MGKFTTTTELARNGKKAFEGLLYSTVLYNNKDIGMIIWKEVADALEESGVLQQIREELWELNDPKTVELVKKSREGDLSGAISLEGFRKKYEI